MIVKIAKIFQAFTYWPIYLSLKFFVRYKIEGQKNLKGLEDKGVIFASNHASFLDGPMCAASIPRNGFYPSGFFPIRFLALRQFYNWINPFGPLCLFIAAYVRVNGSIPIDRTGGDLFKALKDALEALRNGDKVWIYPEGKRTKTGQLQPGKRGVAFLHKHTGAPVVPVGVIGSFRIFGIKKIWGTLLRRNKVTVRIGKPIYNLNSASLEEGAEKVMRGIGNLLTAII